MPSATKNITAKRSRNGSRRCRASAATGLSVIARPATNAARANGYAEESRAQPGQHQAAGHRDQQKQVVLRLQSTSAATAAGRPPRRLWRQRPRRRRRRQDTDLPPSADDRERAGRAAEDADEVLDEAPAKAALHQFRDLVVRRRLRVMLTTTTLEDIAIESPTSPGACRVQCRQPGRRRLRSPT